MTTKLSIKVDGQEHLHSVDKSRSLKENIADICNRFDKDYKKYDYGLKLREEKKKKINRYLTSSTFYNVEDGSCIELVLSVEHIVYKLGVNGKDDIHTLDSNALDDIFIVEIAKQQKQSSIKSLFFKSKGNEKDQASILRALFRLLLMDKIENIETELLLEIIIIIKNRDGKNKNDDLIDIALGFIAQILTKFHMYDNLKESILNNVKVDDIMPFIWWDGHINIQLRTLKLLNAFIECDYFEQLNNREKQKDLLKDINSKKNLTYIYNYIIRKHPIDLIMDSDLGKELSVLQNYILNSLYSGVYKTSSEIPYDEFGCIEGLNNTKILETLESYSTANMTSNDENRFSIATIRNSTATSKSDDTNDENHLISKLTYECLVYYKDEHRKNFIKSKLEEHAYRPGIFETSERVVEMLAKILRIGEKPDYSNTDFHPLLFCTATGHDIFLELFSSTMWILSKTRHEMKAKKFEDYNLVFKILEKKISLVLNEKPLDYKKLEILLIAHDYKDVSSRWVEEQQNEWNNLYNNNPSMQELRVKYREINKQFVFQKRINIMKKGEFFPTIPSEKKTKHNQMFKMILSDNEKIFLMENNTTKTTNPTQFNVEKIRHVIIGEACPHIKNNCLEKKKSALVFSLQLEGDDYINLLAKNVKTANYWIDGINILLDHKYRSTDYETELEELIKMDCELHTIELQNVKIPNEPPKIPRIPKPVIPPKPTLLNFPKLRYIPR